MAVSRVLSEFTYKSTGGSETFYFTIVMDEAQNLSVKNIISPTGVTTPETLVPQAVTDDIQTAIGQVEDLVAQVSATNGILSFVAEETKTVTFATAFQNTNYRVVFSPEEFLPIRVTNKTLSGFTVELGITFTGNVGYDVFV